VCRSTDVVSARLFSLLLLVLCVSACGPYGELRNTVETLTPHGAQKIGECQEFGAYVIDTPGYGCAYFVRGGRKTVSRALAAGLEGDSFSVVCEEDSLSGTIDFRARRGETFVSAKVSRLGSVITMSGEQALNIHKDTRFVTEYRAAPPQHVIMKLVAHEEDRALGGGTRACREYVGILH
jgi:hypothetical protein